MMRGKFIVFEGTDGSGKSSQMKLLDAYLQEKGVTTFLTREPTDSPFGRMLRSCLSGEVKADEKTIAALFAADRLDHILNEEYGIKKLLDDGISVLCDRYYFSSFAYNGGFVPEEWVYALNSEAQRELKADLTIFLDVDIEEGMRRIMRRGVTDRYETRERQIMIRNRYLEIFKRFGEGENIHEVKSLEQKADTQACIRALVDELFRF